MKITPEFEKKKKINYSTIEKNIFEKKNFFAKYLNKYVVLAKCILCGSADLSKITNQYRAFHFSDFTDLDKVTRQYFNNIKFQLNDEALLFCHKCGLIFSNYNYCYQFYFDYMQLDDASDPSSYSEDLLSIDKYYAIKKYNNRIKILNKKKFFNSQPAKKFLEISSYRSWGINELYKNFDVYGIEPHKESIRFSNIKFPHLKEKITNNLFELEEENFNSKKIKFDIVLFSMCFRHMQDPYKSLKILDNITSYKSLVIIDESEFLDKIGIKINSQKDTIKNYLHQFQHGKKFYYSTIHIKSLMAEYSFKLIDEFDCQDTKYPGLTNSLMIFEKQQFYDRSFKEELNNNYKNTEIFLKNKNNFHKYLIENFKIFSIK